MGEWDNHGKRHEGLLVKEEASSPPPPLPLRLLVEEASPLLASPVTHPLHLVQLLCCLEQGAVGLGPLKGGAGVKE